MTNTIYVRPVYIDEDSLKGSETDSPSRDQNGVDQTTNRLGTRVNFDRMNFFAVASRSLNKVGKNWRNTAAGSRINKAFDYGTHEPAVPTRLVQLASIPDMVQGVWSDNFELQLQFTTQFRKISSSENFDRIDKVIKACVVPQFVKFLERQDQPQLQYEAAWALTNFGDVSKETLGNVAGGSPSFNENSKLSMLRNATRTLCEFCLGNGPPFEQVKLVLLALRHLILSTDEQVLTDAYSALYHLCDCATDGRIQEVIDARVFPQLVDLLLHQSGYNSQKQYIHYNKVLPCLYQLLTQNRDENIKIKACWAISNITRGNRGQIQAVFEANIFAPLVHLLQHAEFEIKKEAVEAIFYATSGGSPKQIKYLVNQGCIKPLCDLLVYPDLKCMMVCLKGLENILRAGEEDKELGKNNCVNIYAQMIDEFKGLDKIRNLQSHYDYMIKEKAVEILERYLWWDMVQRVWSDNFELQIEFTTKFRKFSSDYKFDGIEKVIKACVVPRFVEFLERQDLPKLQYEAAWALTNITSGTLEHTQVVIDHDDVLKQALGNVAGGSPSFNKHSKLSMLRNATLTLSGFCKGMLDRFGLSLSDRRDDRVYYKPVLLALRHLIHSTDEQILTDACQGLWYLSRRIPLINCRMQAVIDVGVFPRLVDLLLHPSDKVVEPALQTVGYIFYFEDDAHKKYNQVLPCLYQLLTRNRHENIKKEACWIISKITRGNRDQIQAVIEANIFPPVVHLLQHAVVNINRAAARAISNATSDGSREQIEYLVNQGCIKPLCDLLVYPDSDYMINEIKNDGLKVLKNILRIGKEDKELGKNNGVNIYAQMIDECKGLDKIRNLQSHDDNEIKGKAVEILKRYWVEDEH